MSFPRFDPSQLFKFDFARGQVEVGAAARLMVPADALVALCRGADPEQVRDFGRSVGTEIGRRLAEGLGREIDSAPLEVVVEHLGGELALVGLGTLSLERWGRALVFVLQGSPLGADGDPVVAAVIEGAMQRAIGRDVAAVVLARADGAVRLLLLGAAAAERVRGWLESGTSWGDALSRLHESRGGA